jgi:Ca2+-binding RTX toxin-like protein
MTSTTIAKFFTGIPRVLSVLLVALLSLTSAQAKADEPCPWSEDGDPFWRDFLIHLHLDNYDNTTTHKTKITIGSINFYGSTILAAAVQDLTANTCTNHAIVDDNNSLYGGFITFDSGLCFGPGDDDVEITAADGRVVCGVTYNRPNYNGYSFHVWGESGADILIGGIGQDWLYGGTGADYIFDGSDAAYIGFNIGESGADTVKGGAGNATRVLGGSENDRAFDSGGSTDIIYGDDGNDSCIYDSNGNFDTLDCGTGNDTVHSKSGTINCEFANASC